MNDSDAYRQIGYVLKPKGIRGEFFVFLDADVPQWLAQRQTIFAQQAQGKVPWRILTSRVEKGRLVVRVDALPDRNAVEAARNTPLFVPEAEAREILDEDTFFNSDLVGLTVQDDAGMALGTVTQVIEMPVQNLLDVQRPDGETFLVPFTRHLVTAIDLDAGILMVDLPDGLTDINRDSDSAAGA